jgi:hypothetical protein
MRTINLTAQEIKKIAVAIAGIISAIAAIWYALKILTFGSASEPEAKSWLRFSEVTLIASAILLTFGPLGEWPDSESWKKRLLYKAAKAAVILGVLGELLGDGGIFSSSERLQEIQESHIAAAENRAAKAEERLVAYRKQRILTQGQKDRIAGVTRKFPSIPFVAYTAREQENWTFVLDISSALKGGGWIWMAVPGGLQARNRNLPSEGETIADHVVVMVPEGSEEMGKALVKALTDPAVIDMDEGEVLLEVGSSITRVVVGNKR